MISNFVVKALGPLNFFLGVEALSCDGGLFITQHKYVVNLLRKYSMDKAKLSSMPMATTASLTVVEEELFKNPLLYRSLAGRLQYL